MVLIQLSRTSLFIIGRLTGSVEILLCIGTKIKIVIIQSATIIKKDPKVKIERSLNRITTAIINCPIIRGRTI